MTPLHSPLSTLVPRLPGDILYLVALFSSFETRAILVRCDKWLHETCTPLLFKDIYLHTPIQLVNICLNQQAMRMLNRTRSIYLGEALFSCCSWPSQLLEAVPDLIIHVLSATNSLSRLQIYSSDITLPGPGYDFHRRFDQKLNLAASNPAFLPNLAIIIELPEHISFRSLCNKRPIIYRYHSVDPYMHANICPDFNGDGSGLELSHKLSAYDFGVLIKESEWTSFNVCAASGITIHMRFPDEIKQGGQSPVQDTLSWTRSFLSASETFKELHSLEVLFEPEVPFQSVAVQFAAIEELYEEYPELEDITISCPRFHWSRSVDHAEYKSEHFPEDPLPEWTPHPFDEYIAHWMDWWLQALDLDYPEADDFEEVAQTTNKLIDGMRLRWGSYMGGLPSPDIIMAYFTSNRPERSITPE